MKTQLRFEKDELIILVKNKRDPEWKIEDVSNKMRKVALPK